MHKPKAATNAEGRNAARVILLCFFASGVSGLVYQVVWLRELVLVFGATTFAVSTVLTAFMGGLALGSFWYGRRAEKLTRPLRVYGYLEIGIGIYGLAVPLIFATLTSVYHSFWQWLHLSFLALSIVRFLFASAVLILPTALMGATLPVLSSYYARDANRIGLKVGLLYSVNTFGAVVGAAATGFLLIPMLGMRVTTGVAAALNILLGVVAIRLANADRVTASPAPEEEPRDSSQSTGDLPAERPGVRERARSAASSLGLVMRQALRVHRITALIAFGVSGFVALSYEVIWSRVLALIIGSSVYAFSIMLTTFLIGLALGASIGARFVDRIRNPMVAFAAIELGVGATCLIGAYLFNDLPYVFVQLYRWVDSTSWGVLLVARFLISSLVMIVPTLLLGSLFPLVVRIVSSSEAESERTGGRSAGEAYASNTLGAIAGSFASGFVLIPWVGLLGSLRLCAALNFVVAAGLFISMRSGADPAPRARRRDKARLRGFTLRRAARSWTGVGISGMLIVAAALFEPPWDAEVMSSAVYRYAPQLANKSRQELFDFLKSGQGETIFYEEGITATVAVQQQGGGRVLKVNGKPEASTAGDMPTQILIGSLPLLVRDRTDDVLLIGLGSGVTLGSIEQFPVRQITCVELEPAILEATRYFEDVNNRPLEDPRLRMVSNDGRNFIYTTNETFDVIVSEPSNPWISGVANLF
ncbi:MAG TPA: fused MFS/spermidine synthase, partial [Blastocatellia bacterium]|nr:fused MFS/spermidine synthase [Blastocatellia bacterium]